MKLWLITQDENTGYDTYDSAVVAAETEDQARNTHPSSYSDEGWGLLNGRMCWRGRYARDGDLYETGNGDWADPHAVTVKLIGEAAEGVQAGTICGSFNAG